MRWKMWGLLVAGLLLAAASQATVLRPTRRVAGAVTVTGDGILVNWVVEIDGDVICEHPVVWIATKEIECFP